MPGPFVPKNNRSSTLIRMGKDRCARGWMASLGRDEFYRRRLLWLAEHGKRAAYDRCVEFCRREGIETRREGIDSAELERVFRSALTREVEYPKTPPEGLSPAD